MRLQHSRRATDHAGLTRRARTRIGNLGHDWAPVSGGQLLWWATGLVVVFTLPLVDQTGWRRVGALSVLVTVAIGVLFLIAPWERLPRRCTLLFPLSAWTALTLLGAGTHGIAASYSGLYVLWFAYIGLTQPAGTSLWLGPVACLSYLLALGRITEPLIARLMIAVSVWLLLSELLASLVSRQREMTTELRRLALVDTLTNLANRRDLDLRLATAQPGDTLIICDLDHFKQLNDSQGHAAGDRVLAEFGLVLRSCLRDEDYAARYGGEEFALLLPATSQPQTALILARLRRAWTTLQPAVTFSSGLATFRHQDSAHETLATADQALYAAKAGGRNRDHSSDGQLFVQDAHGAQGVEAPAGG
jgi:diguanylate cyclase (GGDEF)-like protein